VNELDKPFQWYQEKLARELSLEVADPAMGLLMGDPSKLEAIAEHYLDHPEYSRVGREMLLIPLLDCLEDRLECGQLQKNTEALIRRAIIQAMNNLYDRDALRHYWETPDLPNDTNPVGAWLHAQFPEWKPPPSVWSREISNE